MASSDSLTTIGLESAEITALIKEIYAPTPVGKAQPAVKGLGNAFIFPTNAEVDGARQDPRLFIKRGLQILAKVIKNRKDIINDLQAKGQQQLQRNEEIFNELKEVSKDATSQEKRSLKDAVKQLDQNSTQVQECINRLNKSLRKLDKIKDKLVEVMQQLHEEWNEKYQKFGEKFIVELEKATDIRFTQAEKDELIELAKSSEVLVHKRYEELGLKHLM